ncbi:hypothetical protein [Pantoea sp. Cy-640]|uniref:hypothetical protein n=1 Tax=Pantoea sp. Cy-640 TaxID=2608353 RepID=UPI001419CD66|nr:hypothetical protein [Pantoea sp. Cy-640]NIG14196.1 hypothetical protein [Pantoea sp. Cy-640]
MKHKNYDLDHYDIIGFARKIAERAKDVGIINNELKKKRRVHTHIGVVVADAALQAGLNYTNIVKPRLERIYESFPECYKLSNVYSIIQEGRTSKFLNWNHHVKVERFENLVIFLLSYNIEYVEDLYRALEDIEFKKRLLDIHGVGPKTVDYLACLVGIDSIAVDRHIKNFATQAGLHIESYDLIKNIFCYAADLLNIPRRDFDYLIWTFESSISNEKKQLTLF